MRGGKTFDPFAAPEKVHGFSLRCRLKRGPEDWTGVTEKEDAHRVFPPQLTPSSRPELDNPQVLPVPGIVFPASLRTSRAISLTEDLCRLNIQPRWVTRTGEIWGRFNDACCRISMYFEGTKMLDTSNKRSGTSTTNESSLTACRVPRSLRIVGAPKRAIGMQWLHLAFAC